MTDEAMLREAAAIIQDIALCVSDADDTRPLLDELPPSLSDRIAAFLDGHGRALSAPAELDVKALQDALRDPEVQHFLRYGAFWHAATAIRELVAGTGGLSHDHLGIEKCIDE